MLKRALLLLLTLALLCAPALAEDAFGDDFEDDFEDDFDFGDFFSFDDEGYDGTWTRMGDLNMEFCLPDGWTSDISTDESAYAASSDDGTVTMSVTVVEGFVDDLYDWAEQSLSAYEEAEASFYDAALVEESGGARVYILSDSGALVEFRFTGAIDSLFALQIAGSSYELWEGDDFDFDADELDGEGDEDVFLRALEADD